LRAGFFDVSDVPNSSRLEPGFDEHQWLAEIERRFGVASHPGKIALTAFSTHARMALLTEATAWGAAGGVPPDPAQVRKARDRQGVSLNVEQEICEGLGVFLRAGASSGNVETYDFTDIDRTLAVGTAIGALRWDKARDTLGLALVVNGISAQRREYLAAGGLGVLVGDGRLLHAGNEQIAEAYYDLCVLAPPHLTLDFQRVRNPAYNRDRGPASIVALRFHVQI
jgi:high affinity Mn2+ porin